MSEYMVQREFLHDLCNKLSIAQAGLKLSLKKLPKDPFGTQLVIDLEMSLNSIDECICKVKEFRTFVHKLEKEAAQSEENH